MVEIAVIAVAVYASVGLVFAIAFVAIGARRVDPATSGAGVGFRLVILPGCAALWPVLLAKWLRSASKISEAVGHDGAHG